MKQKDSDEEQELEEVLEEENEKASPLADQVKAFLEAEAKKEEGEVKDVEKEDEEAAREMFGEEEEEEEEKKRIPVSPDPAFEENEEPTFNVQVKLSNIPVTEEDQRMYLKSMLNDEPLTLDISLYGGKLVIRARALSVYEQQLAAVATYENAMVRKSAGIAAIVAPTYLQKLRVALQLRTCNGKLISDLSYAPGAGVFSSQAEDLCTKAEKLVGGTGAARWNAYIYALNIFEHKLAKLNEMALNRDFLSPGE